MNAKAVTPAKAGVPLWFSVRGKKAGSRLSPGRRPREGMTGYRVVISPKALT